MIQNREKSLLAEWLPVVGLTFAAFVFNTSEYIPIGLLTDIATGDSLQVPTDGVLISRRAAEDLGLSAGSTIELMDGIRC